MRKLFVLMAFLSMPLWVFADERFVGEKDAPITLIEYGSLTCDACNYFHRAVLPSIKADYIDNGKVRYIYRHFPTGAEALEGAIAVQCAGEKTYEMLNALYLNIEQWYDKDEPAALFGQYAQDLGIDKTSFKQCLSKDTAKLQIVKQQREASNKYGVIGTPTFILNDKVIKGKRNFAQMEALFQEASGDSIVP